MKILLWLLVRDYCKYIRWEVALTQLQNDLLLKKELSWKHKYCTVNFHHGAFLPCLILFIFYRVDGYLWTKPVTCMRTDWIYLCHSLRLLGWGWNKVQERCGKNQELVWRYHPGIWLRLRKATENNAVRISGHGTVPRFLSQRSTNWVTAA